MPDRVVACPRLRDVCAICNNVRLARLDRYGAKLYEQYFATFVSSPVDVTFEYDYPSILGWLLKCSYNATRSEGTDGNEYRLFLPFLRGEQPPPKLSVSLLLGIVSSVPSESPLERQLGPILTPGVCGYGILNVPKGDESLYLIRRMVMMQSYVFFVVVWQPHVVRAGRRRALRNLTAANKVTQLEAMLLLQPGRDRVHLVVPCLDARTWFHVRAMQEGARQAHGQKS